MSSVLHLIIVGALLPIMTLAAGPLAAQPTPVPFDRSVGGQVMLTNSGFGLGGHVRFPLRPDWTAALEVALSAVKDAREVAFFDRFGRRDVPNKANYLLIMPIQIGIERRLFRNNIEDNFRPFVLVAVGPTLGWKYPTFEDENENGIVDTDENTFDAFSGVSGGSLITGVGGTIAIGAHFGLDRRLTQGVRFGYAFNRFRERIELLERGIQEPRRYFSSPTLQFYFARLF